MLSIPVNSDDANIERLHSASFLICKLFILCFSADCWMHCASCRPWRPLCRCLNRRYMTSFSTFEQSQRKSFFAYVGILAEAGFCSEVNKPLCFFMPPGLQQGGTVLNTVLTSFSAIFFSQATLCHECDYCTSVSCTEPKL